MKNKEIIKIIFSMAIALVITQLSTRTIFISNTPHINKYFIAKIVQLPATIIDDTKQYIASFKQNKFVPISGSTVKKLQELPVSAMKQVSKGTYAYSDTENNVLYFRITDLSNYEERTVNLDGKQTKIRFPKGSF